MLEHMVTPELLAVLPTEGLEKGYNDGLRHGVGEDEHMWFSYWLGIVLDPSNWDGKEGNHMKKMFCFVLFRPGLKCLRMKHYIQPYAMLKPHLYFI